MFEIPRAAEELYDTQADPHEMRNLAADSQHRETLEKLRAELETFAKRTDDRVLEKRTPDTFDRETGRLR